MVTKLFDSGRFAPVLVWGSLLVALTLAELAFGYWGWESYGLLGGAAVGMLVFGLWLAVFRGYTRPARELPDESSYTVLAAVGVTVACLGLVAGLWLALPGLGLLAFALAGVLRELVFQRGGR